MVIAGAVGYFGYNMVRASNSATSNLESTDFQNFTATQQEELAELLGVTVTELEITFDSQLLDALNAAVSWAKLGG